MEYIAVLQALAASGAFASRAFLPAFIVAAVARFPGAVSWLPLVPDRPVVLSERLAWLASDPALVALGLLAVAESWAAADEDVRDVVEGVMPWLRSAMAVVVAFGLLDAESAAVLQHLGGAPAGLLSGAAGPAAVALGLGAVVLLLGHVRRALLDPILEADGGSNLIGRFLSRVEDLWAAGGTLLALVAPVVAVLAAAVALGVALLLERRLDARAERVRVPCAGCPKSVRAEALACPACGARRSATAPASSPLWPDRWPDVLLGGDVRAHGLDLLASGRCPGCAERRPSAELLAASPHDCGWPVSAGALGVPGEDAGEALGRHLGRRTLRLVGPVAVIGLLPIVGAVAALVLSRLRVVGPARRHLGTSRRVAARWGARVIVAALLLFSGIPLASAVAAALIVLVHSGIHVAALRRAVAAPPPP